VSEAIYRDDRFKRFIYGWPSHNGDWIWVQHILAHLKVDGRMVVMLDREATSRADDAEVDIRQRFVESELIEAVVLCPWQISRPRWLANVKIQDAVLIVVNKAKTRPGEILFVDTRPLVTDYLTGRLTSDGVHNAIMEALENWTTLAGIAQISPNADVAKTGYSLAPELYCAGHALSR
jgi:type I restriction enzyme M protein